MSFIADATLPDAVIVWGIAGQASRQVPLLIPLNWPASSRTSRFHAQQHLTEAVQFFYSYLNGPNPGMDEQA
jgi:hypothetical protein